MSGHMIGVMKGIFIAVMFGIAGCGGGGGNAPNNNTTLAEAGPAQNVIAGNLVTLDGSRSTGADGSLISYQWSMVSQPGGSTAAINNPTTVNPTFMADVEGQYILKLTVTDGKSTTSVDAVTITASTPATNATPVANAGIAQNVLAATLVTLDGSGSSDANGDPLTYSWAFTSKPNGSNAVLSNATDVKPVFTPDAPGTYVINLIVNDGKVSSTASTVMVTAFVANATPVANAGIAQNVLTTTLVTLDGSGSSDANGDPLTYSWAFTSKPNGSNAVLSNATDVKPVFTPDVPGTYVINLIVNDGKVSSDPSAVTVVAGTAVSGIITTNTTWAVANSPYQMIGNVQVDFGVTLVIEPGVTVAGNGFSLVVGGTLTAQGVANNRIRFNKVSIKPAASHPSITHRIDIRFADIQGGSLYAPTGNAVYGTFALSDSRVESLLSYIYVWYPTSTVLIERNIFLNSGGISVGFDSRVTPIEVIIRNNYFENWSGNYAIENWAAYGSAVGVQAELNTFASLNRVAVRLPPGYSFAALTAANNWWGTNNTSVISTMIFDRNDDISSAGVIGFQPILTSPDPVTPTP